MAASIEGVEETFKGVEKTFRGVEIVAPYIYYIQVLDFVVIGEVKKLSYQYNL